MFVKAITTIRALSSRSNHGSLPRPPAENRIKLYGLYKQATEGDVEGIMARPVGFTLEDEGAKKKWDAWKREQGKSKTEAKRQYISYLIDTMKVYANSTLEARELLAELEYLWDQIKDIEFSAEDELDHIPNIPFPTHSPLFSQYDQSDRYSTITPLPLPSTHSNNPNLHKIYSHSRRSTMLSINDYVQQQRNQLPKPSVPVSNVDEFKNWQGEINMIINKLSREFLQRQHSDSESEDLDPTNQIKQRLFLVIKLVGKSLIRALRSFSASILAILFIVWCIKRNVVVKRTIVRNQGKEELVINMILNTDKNKWFIRLLAVVNSFVGFV